MEISSLFKNIYQNKRVFITGHTGFKGSWLALWLAEMGAHVKGYALAPEKGSLYGRLDGSLKVQSVIADIRDYKKLQLEIADFNPDFIFHLAAQPLVRYSYEQPLETFEVNAMGTGNLLQAVAQLKDKCVVVAVTTDKVYENLEVDYAYKESDKLGGHDPYSASKACAEIIIQSYRLSFFNPKSFENHNKSIASARAGNVIGGGDYAKDRIVPDIVRALQAKQAVKIRNPKSIRPWQHVLDPLAGYLLLGAKMSSDPVRYSMAYNFGPNADDKMTVEELVKELIASWKEGSYVAEPASDKLHEAGLLMLANTKAKVELGWLPRYASAEAVHRTAEWYKNSSLGQDALSLCLNDIRAYVSNLQVK